MGTNLKLACLLITASAGLIVFSFVPMEFVLKLACLLITATVGASAVMIGVSASEFVYSHTSQKNEKKVIASSADVYIDLHIDKVVIEAGGVEVTLSIRAEEYLRNLLNKREKSSLLYT